MEEMTFGNEVLLRGRVRRPGAEKTLPSGDALVTMRLVVPRAEREAGRPSSDWVDCTAWSARARRQLLAWAEGDVVEVRGQLRRRFFRSTGGAADTRLEVEVTGGKRLSRAS